MEIKKINTPKKRVFTLIILFLSVILLGCQEGYTGKEQKINRICPFIKVKYLGQEKPHFPQFQFTNTLKQEIFIANGSVNLYSQQGKFIAGLWIHNMKSIPPQKSIEWIKWLPESAASIVQLLKKQHKDIKIELQLFSYFLKDSENMVFKEFSPPLFKAVFKGGASGSSKVTFPYYIKNTSGRHVAKLDGLVNIWKKSNPANKYGSLYFRGLFFFLNHPFSNGKTLEQEKTFLPNPTESTGGILTNMPEYVHLEIKVSKIYYKTGEIEIYY